MGCKKNENNPAESEKNAGNVNFVWTDDEVELLLGVIIHFKAEKEAEGYDWESVKTKYESIKPIFHWRIFSREATFFFCLNLISSTWFQPKAQGQREKVASRENIR